MIHYSVSDGIAEIRIDHLPVNGLGVSKINDLIAALSRAAAAANGSRRGQHRRPPEQTHGAIPAHLLDHCIPRRSFTTQKGPVCS